MQHLKIEKQQRLEHHNASVKNGQVLPLQEIGRLPTLYNVDIYTHKSVGEGSFEVHSDVEKKVEISASEKKFPTCKRKGVRNALLPMLEMPTDGAHRQ